MSIVNNQQSGSGLRPFIWPFIGPVRPTPGENRPLVAHHRRTLTALQSGDPYAAEQSMREHIWGAREHAARHSGLAPRR